MKKKLPYLYITLSVTLLLTLVIFAYQRNKGRIVQKELDVKVVDKNESKFLNVNIVTKIIANQFKKELADTMNYAIVHRIEKELNKHPFIKKSEVCIGPQKKMKVKVTQKTPIARVHSKTEEYYITENAEKVRLSKVYSANVMLVNGEFEKKEYKKIVRFIHYIKQDTLLNKQVIGIRKQQADNYLLTTKVGKHFVEIGELVNLEQKFEKLKSFYNQYLNYTDMNKYKKISLKYNNQIVCTKR